MHHHKEKYIKNLIKLFSALLLLIFFIACSPKTRYNVLSVFFDGVPNPDNKSKNITTEANSQSKPDPTLSKNVIVSDKPKSSTHPPYSNRKCDACHDPNIMGKVLEPLPGLCYKCHKNVDSTYAFVHGPVENGYCTACHSPHFASEPKLLLRKGQSLCLVCHSIVDVLRNENHTDIGDNDCRECHNPHGGTNKFYLN